MAPSRATEILNFVVVAVLSSGVIGSIMFVIVQVQLGEIEARHKEQIAELRVAIADAKDSCSRVKEDASKPVPQLLTSPRRLDKHTRRPHHRRRHKRNHIMQVAHNAIAQVTADPDVIQPSWCRTNCTVKWRRDTVDYSDGDTLPYYMFIGDSRENEVTKIKIIQTGFYFVFAQVKFNGNQQPRHPYQTFFIKRTPMGYGDRSFVVAEKTIVQAKINNNRGKSNPLDMSYTGKLALLHHGDEIFLQIRWGNFSQVIYDQDTYMGLIFEGDQA